MDPTWVVRLDPDPSPTTHPNAYPHGNTGPALSRDPSIGESAGDGTGAGTDLARSNAIARDHLSPEPSPATANDEPSSDTAARVSARSPEPATPARPFVPGSAIVVPLLASAAVDEWWKSRWPEVPRLAVKDCIDVAGVPTVGGSRALANVPPARFDAPVVATARAQGAALVGKTGLVELCRRADGRNAWTGTPTNPIDPTRLPGGSSSGSAVAVARGEADVAYGSDTGGSIRVPAACCGVAGLKTTTGRIPTHGVLEFSRTLDSVGPLARDVAGLALGMRLMEPGFTPLPPSAAPLPPSIARVRLTAPGLEVDPAIDTAVDDALRAAGVTIVDVELPDWPTWIEAADDIMIFEGYWAQRAYADDTPDLLEPAHLRNILAGASINAQRVVECRRIGAAARTVLRALLDTHGLIALPTIRQVPPRLDEPASLTPLAVPLNLTGNPAVALPIPRTDGGFPASLQLVGPWYAEETLLPQAYALTTPLQT